MKGLARLAVLGAAAGCSSITGEVPFGQHAVMSTDPIAGGSPMTPEIVSTLMPLAVSLGVEFTSVGPAEVCATMPWKRENLTMVGTVHGGALMGMADSAGAACAFFNLPAGATTITIESKTNFFRGVSSGAVHSTTRALHVGRSIIVVQTDIVDDDGRHVAETTQTQTVTQPI